MTTPAKLFLQRDFQALKRFPRSSDYVIYDLQNDNIFNWYIYLFGPEGTCYEDGVFRCLMRFPLEFPHEPPSLQFLTPIFHPNIFKDGKVCISTLQLPLPEATAEESSLCWTAVLGVGGALQSVVSLLADPNPLDAANPQAAAEMLNNRPAFEARARELSKQSKAHLLADVTRPIIQTPPEAPIVHGIHKAAPDEDDDESYVYGSDQDCGDIDDSES